VTVVKETFVPSLVKTIFASGIAAPVESVTVPVKRDVVPCANIELTRDRDIRTTPIKIILLTIELPP
jgi:hypothetical protein